MTTNPDFHPAAERLLGHNVDFAERFHDAALQVAPTLQLAVVVCMDSRMDIFQILGLENGQAHVIRNAGGVITDDVERSLCLSQRRLGTREIILLHHTDCGLENLDAVDLRRELEAEVGVRPPWTFEAFDDPYADTRQSMQRLLLSPFVLHKDHIRGFVYDVERGVLREATID